MGSETLVFRCDADTSIGIGHVMRCLALAQAWQAAGGRTVFAVAELPAGLENRLRTGGSELVRLQNGRGTHSDAAATIHAARQARAGWAVVDGDAFGVDFLRAVQDSSVRVLLIDDFASRESFPADLIVNPNLGASEDSYRQKCSKAGLLLGPSYVMLRREFTSWHGERVFAECGSRVLVSLGGSDPENLAPRIVETLRNVDSLQLTVVAGAAYPRWHELQESCAGDVQVTCNPSNMPELMREADLAIAVAGGTLWELLYMGCAVLSYARNPVQARVVDRVAEQRAARNLGDTGEFDGPALAVAVAGIASDRLLRERMAAAGRRLIDGMGANRVLEAIEGMT
jgi:UDP-2,4-diacetamido-2,4,6-trideoxy-beta-L-altropyranose hydrolase